MLSVLLRAAQIKGSCRCPQYLPRPQRATGTANTPRSVLRPQCGTSSTLWYAGFFATAATYDAGVKIQKRHQSIDAAKQELGGRDRNGEEQVCVDEQSDLGAQEVGHASHTPDGLDMDSEPRSVIPTPFEAAGAFETDLERNLDSSAYRTYVPRWPSNTGPVLNRLHLPPQSIYATNHQKLQAEKTRWYEKKLLRVQLAMDMLQLNFFIWLHKRRRAEEVARSVPSPYAACMGQDQITLERILEQKKADFDRLLHTHGDESGHFYHFRRSPGDVPLCHYLEDDLGAFRIEQRELRQSIEDIFQKNSAIAGPGPIYRQRQRYRGLGEIFCRLSMSSAPPSVDVYNTLINGLRKEGHVTLTKGVIRTFLRSKMRPNEVSLASVLGFYTDIDEVELFRDWVRLMRGENGGLMESAPWNWRFKASNGRIVQRVDKPGRLVQLPYPTPMVLDALVKGVLHFSGFSAALDLCRNLGPQGWGMDMQGFGILLGDCAVRGDWDSGFAIWNQILLLKQKSDQLADGRGHTETIMTPLFADMLRLCRRCNKKQAFADVWKQASKTHPKAIARIMDIIRVESAMHQSPASSADKMVVQRSVNAHDNVIGYSSDEVAQDRERALDALAQLRAQPVHGTHHRNLQQEYIALQADVDFLKAMESKPQAAQPKRRTWAELAKSAYSLIAAHPETLENRVYSSGNDHYPRADVRQNPVSYTELARSAYHLVADHPSTLEQREWPLGRQDSMHNPRTPVELGDEGRERVVPQTASHVGGSLDGDECGGTVEGAAEAGHHLIEHSAEKPQTYTSLLRNAYRLIADHPSTLERRELHADRKLQQHVVAAVDIMSHRSSEADTKAHATTDGQNADVSKTAKDVAGSEEVTLGQLHGREGGADKLDDYEAEERPKQHPPSRH